MPIEISRLEISEYLNDRFMLLFCDITGLSKNFAPEFEIREDNKFGEKIFGDCYDGIRLGRYFYKTDEIKLNEDAIYRHISSLYQCEIYKTYTKRSSLLFGELVLIHELFHVKQSKVDNVCFDDIEREVIEKETDHLAIQFLLENVDGHIPKDEIAEIIKYYTDLRKQVLKKF